MAPSSAEPRPRASAPFCTVHPIPRIADGSTPTGVTNRESCRIVNAADATDSRGVTARISGRRRISSRKPVSIISSLAAPMAEDPPNARRTAPGSTVISFIDPTDVATLAMLDWYRPMPSAINTTTAVVPMITPTAENAARNRSRFRFSRISRIRSRVFI